MLRMSLRILFTSSGLAAAGGLVGAGLRLLAVPPAVGDVDGVNFARALRSFEPLEQSPHLPGYPVYVAVTKPFAALGLPESLALALPSALLWPLAAWTLFVGLRRLLGEAPALAASLVASLSPGAVLIGGWPASDGFGLALLCLASGMLAHGVAGRERSLLLGGALLLGLLLGVRLSWAPLVAALGLAALVAARQERGRLASAFGLGVLAWGAPLFALVGPGLIGHALAFGRGHLERWGGTAVSTSAPLFERGLRALWDVWAAGLGAPWAGSLSLASALVLVVIVAALFGLVRARPPRALLAITVLALPYAGLAVVLQNVEKPRHLVVLLPLVGAWLGLGLTRLRRAEVGAGALAVVLVAVTLPRALEQGRELSPALRLVAHVAQRPSPARLQVFAGEEARLFEHHLPMVRVWRPKGGDVLAREAALASARGAEVLVSSGTPGIERLAGALEPVATFSGSEVVYAHDPSLTLFRFAPREAP